MKIWNVYVKGRPNDYYEISVLRRGNTHGRISYGWGGPDKIIVSSSGGPCAYKVPKSLFERLVKVAQDYADELNSLEPVEHTFNTTEEYNNWTKKFP